MMQKQKEKKEHSLKLLIRTVVTGPDGKVIHDSGQKPSRSYVIQFLELIRYFFDGPATGTATDVTGAESFIYHATWASKDQARVDAPINISTYGIVVGSSNTAETNTDFKLGTQMTEGTGAGQITHNECTIDAIAAIVGANVDLVIKRSFTNNTGALRTVKEVGIYVVMIGQNKFHCLTRDVLGAPIDVPASCSLTVYYTMRTTV